MFTPFLTTVLNAGEGFRRLLLVADTRHVKNSLFAKLWTAMCLSSLLIGDGVPSSVASFNDSRCVAGGVCSTDPLLFTCELYHVTGIRVRLPNGEHESISLGDTAADIVLSAGYTATSVNITKIDEFLRNVHLTVYIVNASLLNGGEIMCDDHVGGDVMAACLLRSTCNGSDDDGDNGGDANGGGGNGLFTGALSGIVGGGVAVVVIVGGISILVIFLFKKMKTNQPDREMSFLSPSPGPASPVIEETPANGSGDVDLTYYSPIMDTPHSKHIVQTECPVVNFPAAVSADIEHAYSTIPDLNNHPSIPASPVMKETPAAGPSDANLEHKDSSTAMFTPDPHQPSPASSVKKGIQTGSANHSYQVPSTIIRTPHPNTGVVYTDINPEMKKKGHAQKEDIHSSLTPSASP